MFRRLLVTSATVLVVGLASTWTGSSPVRAQTDCQTPAPSDAQHFSGETSTVTDPFVVDSGVLKVTGSHQGDANFIVMAYNEAGDKEYLFNEIGPYTGQTTLKVEPGSKLILDVQANGPWEITMEPAF
jgi:hypothetical protein